MAADSADSADSVWLEVEHSTRYHYTSPVSLAHHRAHLRPLQDDAQALDDFDLELDPPPGARRAGVDGFGNPQLHFEIAGQHERLHVRSRSRLRLRPRFAHFEPAATAAWEQVADALRYRPRVSPPLAAEFVHPSPFVPRLPGLRPLIEPLLEPGRPVAALALALMHEIHTGLRYQSQSTTVDTPLAQVLQQRRGVCQDFAHAMIGALRSAGLAARYVSGYLLTQAPEDGRALVGADASHAWVQLWCPLAADLRAADAQTTEAGGADGDVAAPQPLAGTWLDLDPTNNCVPAAGHVRLAVGRDYGDVAPLRGVIRGGGDHRLEVAVRTRRLPPPTTATSAAPAAPA